MWYRPRPGIADHGLALAGVYAAVIGFGLLTIHAGLGILLIPAGLILFLFGHSRR